MISRLRSESGDLDSLKLEIKDSLLALGIAPIEIDEDSDTVSSGEVCSNI